MKRPEYSIKEIWETVRSALAKLSFFWIKRVAGIGGIDMTALAQFVQEGPSVSSKETLLSAFDRQIGLMPPDKQEQFVRITAEELMAHTKELREEINDRLRRLGWSFSKGKLMPLSLIDELDLAVIPPESVEDLIEAAKRLRDGDLTGALTAAAGTVESACAEIYAQKGLGDPSEAIFQEKVARCLATCSSYETMQQELIGIGWQPV